jgi:hypothetical protein
MMQGGRRLTTSARAIAIGAGVLAVATAAFMVLTGRAEDLPIPGITKPEACPLTGLEPKREELIDRPAVAIKVENAEAAWPLSGLEKADLVYEELVEGGLTRFMAIYHCEDSTKVGPIRSVREVDPAIMAPTTKIVAASGGNKAVRDVLTEEGVVLIDEGAAGAAMRRVPREGLGLEHTLYGTSSKLRSRGAKKYSEVPPDDLFEFGDLPRGAKKASTVTINFNPANTITYEWSRGRWMRSQVGVPFVAESGKQIGVDNVLIEEHTINFSNITDVLGTPSTQIEDVTGSGLAILFRDGRAIRGRWVRESREEAVAFESRDGQPLILHPGRTWIEIVPNDKGEAKGSFSYES